MCLSWDMVGQGELVSGAHFAQYSQRERAKEMENDDGEGMLAEPKKNDLHFESHSNRAYW